MSLEPYKCLLDPDTDTTLTVYLFENVKNTDTVKNNVINGTWKCAIIKPYIILDLFQVAIAANRAMLSQQSKTMVTKTVYSEILYNLSLTKNISHSLSKFGIEEDDTMLVCFLVNNEDNHVTNVIEQIDGKQCPVSSLSSYTNLKAVKNVYKLNSFKNEVDLLDVIVSRMVTKSFINH